MEIIIKDIINKLEEQIEIANINSTYLDKIISTQFDFSINFNNERTVASFLLNCIVEELNKLGLPYIDFYNEFDVTMNQTISTEQAMLIEDEIEGTTLNESSVRKYVPDNYIFINKNDDFYHIFIEYKKNNKLDYMKLANDFLKFKIYTRNYDKNVIFIYVVFKPVTNKKTITLKNIKGTVEYQLLNRSIEKKDIDKDKSIFIFKASDYEINSIKTKNIEQSVITIDESLRRLLDLGYEGSYEFSFKQSPYYATMGMFGPNVIVSNHLRYNYNKILTLFNEIRREDFNVEIPKSGYINLEQFRENIQFDEKIFTRDLTKHFNSQINKITKEHADSISKSEFNFTRRKSFWITILLHKFCRDNGIKISFFDLSVVKESEDIVKSVEHLDAVYKSKDNFNMLCIGLVYYIVKLYSLIMNYSNNIAKLSDAYLSHKKVDILLDNIKKISKIFTIKFDLKEYQENFVDTSIKFLNELINKITVSNEESDS